MCYDFSWFSSKRLSNLNQDFDKIQKNFYSSAEVKRFYWQTENYYVKNKECQLLSFLKDLIKPEDKLLEVGCGEGANLKNLRSIGIDNKFTGIDFSEEKVLFCKNLNINRAEFLVSDARKLPFEDNHYNITFARDLLHHVNENRLEVINELHRVTKPGGRVIIIEGNVEKLTNFVFASIFKHEQGMKDSTHKKLTALLTGFDYELYSDETTNFFRFLLHYSIGMPYLARIKPICWLLDQQEKLFRKTLPKKKWAYWVIIITKTT